MNRISDMIFRGFCICESGDKYITVNKTPRKGKWIIGDICHLPLGQAAIMEPPYSYAAVPETVGRYSSVNDEDEMMIFEGDVVEYNDGINYFKGKVMLLSGAFGVFCDEEIPFEYAGGRKFVSFHEIICNDGWIDTGNVRNVKVIGNIFETREGE